MPNIFMQSAADAERFLLGCSLRDSLGLPEGLTPDMFGEPMLRDVAGAIALCQANNEAYDAIIIGNKLGSVGAPIDRYKLFALTNEVENAVPHQKEWADIIINAAKLRKIAEIGRAILRTTETPEGVNADTLRDFVEKSLPKTKPKEVAQPTDDSTEYFSLDDMLKFDPKTDPDVLIGENGKRWISKGYPFQIVGFSGTGKSSMAVHLAVHWAIGQAPWGLKPVRELRILMVQAENDLGDASEALIGATAKLTEKQKDTLRENLVFVRQAKKVGLAFVEYLGQMVEKHKIDLVIVDPLLAYADFDIASQPETTAFLRGPGGVFEMLQRTKAALLYMHHTTKPKSADDLDAMTPQQLAYLGAGCAEWVNFARDSGYLFRTSTNTSDGRAIYRFGFSKRQSRSGIREEGGAYSKSGHIHLCHAEGNIIRWEYAPPSMESTSQRGHSSPAKGSPWRPESM